MTEPATTTAGDKADGWHSMKLDDRYAPSLNSMVTRVPGGWIFESESGVCFIPFNDEFQPVDPNAEYLPF